jgi:hypothetical protein
LIILKTIYECGKYHSENLLNNEHGCKNEGQGYKTDLFVDRYKCESGWGNEVLTNFFHLFIYVYNVWAITAPYLLPPLSPSPLSPSPPYSLASRQK